MSSSAAPTPVRHFAINADDTTRAQAFYGSVFGWTFNAWGPPGFWMIDTGARDTGTPMGALQQRRALVEGERITGFECTISTPDIRATERAILAAGGSIIMPRTTIPGVGHLLWFRDTEGNVAGAMQYDSGARVDE